MWNYSKKKKVLCRFSFFSLWCHKWHRHFWSLFQVHHQPRVGPAPLTCSKASVLAASCKHWAKQGLILWHLITWGGRRTRSCSFNVTPPTLHHPRVHMLTRLPLFSLFHCLPCGHVQTIATSVNLGRSKLHACPCARGCVYQCAFWVFVFVLGSKVNIPAGESLTLLISEYSGAAPRFLMQLLCGERGIWKKGRRQLSGNCLHPAVHARPEVAMKHLREKLANWFPSPGLVIWSQISWRM